MLVKKIKYEDYDGNMREEDFYFNLSRAEVADMDLSETGGLKRKLDRIIESQDTAEIYKIFKEIVLKAYGVKSDDGRRFVKSQELREGFMQTEAFSVLMMEFLGGGDGAEKAADFVKGILPNVPADRPALSAVDGTALPAAG